MAIHIEKQIIPCNAFSIPVITLSPSKPLGAVVIIHGYGGCKEEQLGIAWRVAHAGFAACTIDLRGHGENELPFDEHLIEDVNAVVNHFKKQGKVAAIGHSLGGRLSLLSDADYTIGISPALPPTYGDYTHATIKKSRSYRVNEKAFGDIFRIMQVIPLWQSNCKPTAIIYGSRDIPEIVEWCKEARAVCPNVIEIENAMHFDIIHHETTFSKVTGHLNEWFKNDH